MKKIIYLLIFLITSFSYSQTQSIGATIINGGAKGNMPSFVINGTTVQDGSNITIEGGSGVIANTFAATSKADLENVANVGKVAIIDVIDLGGQTVTLQDGMLLYFTGTGFSNGTVTGVNSKIQASISQIFSSDVTVNGTWVLEKIYPEWFGAKGDGVTDDTAILHKTSDFIGSIGGGVFQFTKPTYLINITDLSSTGRRGLNIHSNTIIDGNGVATIKLIPNNEIGYNIIDIANVENVVLQNINVEGDRYEHLYSEDAGTFIIGTDYEILTLGTTDFTAIGASSNTVGLTFVPTGAGTGTGTAMRTHEHGLGISIANSANVTCRNFKSYYATGDNLTVGFSRKSFLGNQDVSTGDMAVGGIDDNGVADLGLSGYYTTKFFNLASITDDYFHFWARSWSQSYKTSFARSRVFYYDASDNLLETRDFLQYEHTEKTSDLPTGATKAKVWYRDMENPAASGSKIDFGGGRWGCRNITIENFELYECRRNGITGGGVINMKIQNGRIHHIKGIAPESGSDFEEGTNRYITVDNVQYDHNIANFLSPSGNFITVKNCIFQDAPKGSSLSTGTGSINMSDCVLINHSAALSGKSNLSNVQFRNVTITDEGGTIADYNNKVFTDCTFEDCSTGFSLDDNFGTVTFNGGIYKNTSLPINPNTIFNTVYYNSSNNVGGYFNNCKIDIDADVFITAGTTIKNSEVYRSVAPTGTGFINIGADCKILNSTIDDIATGQSGNILIGANTEIRNSTINIDRNFAFGSEGFFTNGANIVIDGLIVNHTGSITNFNSAMINLANATNLRITNSRFNTTSADNSRLFRQDGSGTYDLFNSIVEGVTLPADDASNRLHNNLEL